MLKTKRVKQLFRTFSSSSEGENVKNISQSFTNTIIFPCLQIMPLHFVDLLMHSLHIVYHGNEHLLHNMFKKWDEACPPPSWESPSPST